VTLTFFTDRDLGRQFPTILRAAGLQVVAHSDLFAPATPDEEWLERAGTEGWIAITHDRRIRYRPNEREAVLRHGLGLLIVIGDVPFAQLATNFVVTLTGIEAFVAGQPRPFIAKVYRPSPADVARDPAARGRVDLWYPR